MKFLIITLGCKVNAYESELMKELLLKEGYIESDDPDIIIVNTCTVTNVADNKSLKTIRHIKKTYPQKILAVCGCSVQNNQEQYQNLGIDILIGNQKKSQIVSIIKEYLEKNQKYTYINQNRDIPFENMQIEKFTTHTRGYVKIEDGCDNFCSYCVIPYVRGKKRSKDFNQVIEEVEKLTQNNHQEIVLTGIHTGAYEDNNHDLTDLIHEISKNPKLKRIRLSSVEITELNDKFLNELKNNPKIVSHLHIPIQSGSDEILKKMNRKYDLKYFEQKINAIRKIRPDIAITTDCLVGHPYETQETFNQTIETIKKLNFAKVHVFPYSRRSKTKADTMPNQVPNEIKKQWARQLIKISDELEENYYKAFIGQEKEVLIEKSANPAIGLTDNYLKVKINQKLNQNELIKVKLTKYENKFLIGKVI